MNLVTLPQYFSVIKSVTFKNFAAKTLSIIHGSESQQAGSKPAVSTVTSNSTAAKSLKSINIISSFTIPATTSQATTLPAPSDSQKVIEKKTVETPPAKFKGKAKVSYLPYYHHCNFNLFKYSQILHTSPKLLKRGRGRPPKKPPSKAEPAEENNSDDEEENEENSQDEDEGKSFYFKL